MGTNYYLVIASGEPCASCGHVEHERRIHIGKSSAGWAFSLHVYPLGSLDPSVAHNHAPPIVINDLFDWLPLFQQHAVENEYGERITAIDMMQIISERTHPRGLKRHEVEAGRCLGPGAGTWDRLIGWFHACPVDTQRTRS